MNETFSRWSKCCPNLVTDSEKPSTQDKDKEKVTSAIFLYRDTNMCHQGGEGKNEKSHRRRQMPYADYTLELTHLLSIGKLMNASVANRD